MKLIAYFALAALSAAQLPQPQLVDVLNELPGHIEFAFFSGVQFLPLTLKANISSAPQQEVRFSSIGDNKKKIFRNMMSQQLTVNDVISGLLVYKLSAQHPTLRRQLQFNYVITDKHNDTFSIDLSASSPLEARVHAKAKTEDQLELIFNTPTTKAKATVSTTKQPTTSTTTTTTTTAATPIDCSTTNAEGTKYQEELLQTTLTQTKFGSRLLLQLRKPPRASAVDTIRSIITDKLQLPHLAYKILQAKFLNEGVLFEMDTPRDAVEVLTQTRLRLKESRLNIQPTEREFFEVGGFYRMQT